MLQESLHCIHSAEPQPERSVWCRPPNKKPDAQINFVVTVHLCADQGPHIDHVHVSVCLMQCQHLWQSVYINGHMRSLSLCCTALINCRNIAGIYCRHLNAASGPEHRGLQLTVKHHHRLFTFVNAFWWRETVCLQMVHHGKLVSYAWSLCQQAMHVSWNNATLHIECMTQERLSCSCNETQLFYMLLLCVAAVSYTCLFLTNDVTALCKT